MEISHSNGESTVSFTCIQARYLLNDTGCLSNMSTGLEKSCDTQFSGTEEYILECFGAIHIPIQGEPFDRLAMKMTALKNTHGKIKKRVLREGYGPIIPRSCMVTITYRSYIKYQEPYSLRNNFTFHLTDEKVSCGLKIAVQSMKMNEISQFLVNSEYILVTKNIPADSFILYEIQLRQHLVVCYMFGKRQKFKSEYFDQAYKSALALCSKGNNFYRDGKIEDAIKAYSNAESKLDNFSLWRCEATKQNQQDQETLLLRLRSNLIVAYTKIQKPHLSCLVYNRIHYMSKRLKLKINSKVFYNHARSLRLLSHYSCAEKQLQQALKLEPSSLIITKELRKLNVQQQEHFNKQLQLAKSTFRNVEIFMDFDNDGIITKEFKKCLSEFCEDLSKDDDSILYNLPDKLTEPELYFIKEEGLKYGLQLNCAKTYSSNVNIIIKHSIA